MSESTKQCPKCNTVRSVAEFYPSSFVRKDGTKGLLIPCIPCRQIVNKEIWNSDPINIQKQIQRKIDKNKPPALPILESKQCGKCKKVLPISEFEILRNKNKKGKIIKLSYTSYCSPCKDEYGREYGKKKYADPEWKKKKLEQQRTKSATDPEWREKRNEKRKLRRINDPEWAESFRKKQRDKWKNDPEYRKNKMDYIKDRYHNDPQYNIMERIRSDIGKAFRKYSSTGKIWKSIRKEIDYGSIIKRLGLPPEGGGEYHIDHIIPRVLFDHSEDNQVRLCWSPENLQWLSKFDNESKGDDFSENMEDYPEELHQHWKVAYKNYLDKKV